MRRAAVELHGDTPLRATYVDTPGWALFRLGRCRQARARLKEAVMLDEYDLRMRSRPDEVEGELSRLDRLFSWLPS